MNAWNYELLKRAPMLASLRTVVSRLAHGDWPDVAVLQDLLVHADVRNASALPLQLVPMTAGGDPYEIRLYARGELAFRPNNWHDLFNVLSWLLFPHAKAALNARHHAEFAHPPAAGGRGPVRDALTLFDEDGVVVIAADPALLTMIRNFQWKPLFWEHRSAVTGRMCFLPFGHALCEKALAPYRGMTGRGLLLQVDPAFFDLGPEEQLRSVDESVAQRIADVAAFAGTGDLAPVPVLGVPGWCESNACAEYYDDQTYFRPGRVRRTSAARPSAASGSGSGE